jgi:hypothetical protein
VRVVVASVLLGSLLVLGAAPAEAEDFRTPSPAAKATCDCASFERALAEARALYVSRQEDV